MAWRTVGFSKQGKDNGTFRSLWKTVHGNGLQKVEN
jgi:hypothetical protein